MPKLKVSYATHAKPRKTCDVRRPRGFPAVAVHTYGSGEIRVRSGCGTQQGPGWCSLMLPQCCRSAAAVLRVGSCVPSVYLLLAPLLEYYLVSLLVLFQATAGRLLVRGRGRGLGLGLATPNATLALT